VMIRKGLPSIAELQRLGVARVSFGPSASYATMGLLRRASAEVLERGTYATLLDGAISYDALNRLASPRRGSSRLAAVGPQAWRRIPTGGRLLTARGTLAPASRPRPFPSCASPP